MPEKNDSVNESGCEQANRLPSSHELEWQSDGINLPPPSAKTNKKDSPGRVSADGLSACCL